jgi:REP element-mobilizing transposase RayT
MTQSLVKRSIQIIGAKYWQPLIDDAIENKLHTYYAGLCYAQEEIKKRSLKWIKTKGKAYENFYWQNGYGTFTQNSAELDVVIRYIRNQHEQRSKKTLQDEYL